MSWKVIIIIFLFGLGRTGQLSPIFPSDNAAACTLSPSAIDYRFQKRNSLGCPQTPFFPIFILLKTGKRKQNEESP